MDGYIKSTELSSSVGMSDRRVKEIARKANLEYIAVKPDAGDGFYWLPEKDAYGAIIAASKKATAARKKGAKKAVKTRAKKKEDEAKALAEAEKELEQAVASDGANSGKKNLKANQART
jgi:hypothetical protein